MLPGELVRAGLDADTTDVVFRENGGSRGRALVIALASVAGLSIVFGGAGLVITLVMVGSAPASRGRCSWPACLRRPAR